MRAIGPCREVHSSAVLWLWLQTDRRPPKGPWRAPAFLEPVPCPGCLFEPAHRLPFVDGEPSLAAPLHAGDIAARQWQSPVVSRLVLERREP